MNKVITLILGRDKYVCKNHVKEDLPGLGFTKKLTIIMVGLEIVKFLSSSNDSMSYWGNAQIIFSASQGGLNKYAQYQRCIRSIF
jgi:hypothetical protein